MIIRDILKEENEGNLTKLQKLRKSLKRKEDQVLRMSGGDGKISKLEKLVKYNQNLKKRLPNAPRPGLVWNEQKHRWLKTEEEGKLRDTEISPEERQAIKRTEKDAKQQALEERGYSERQEDGKTKITPRTMPKETAESLGIEDVKYGPTKDPWHKKLNVKRTEISDEHVKFSRGNNVVDMVNSGIDWVLYHNRKIMNRFPKESEAYSAVSKIFS